MKKNYQQLSDLCLSYISRFANEIRSGWSITGNNPNNITYRLWKFFTILHVSFDEAAIHGHFKDKIALIILLNELQEFRESEEYVIALELNKVGAGGSDLTSGVDKKLAELIEVLESVTKN